MKLTLEAVAALTGGKILSGDPELTVFGVRRFSSRRIS